MAFDPLYLASAGAQSKRGVSPQQFTLMTADSRATVLAAGYIPAAYARLFSIGDMIDFTIVDSVTAPTQLQEVGSLTVTNVSSAGVVSLTDTTPPNSFGSSNYIRMPFFFSETDLLAGTSQWTMSPVAGTLRRIVTFVKKQVTTGGDIGVKLAGVAVTGLAVTVADSAAVGTVQSDTPTSVNRLTADQAIEVTAAAAFATAGQVFGYVEIVPDAWNGDIYVPFFANATDLSAGTSQFWPNPEAGQIIKAAGVVQEVIVTGGDLTFKLATVAVVGLTVTIADAAAVGTVVTDTPTSLTGATGVVAKNVSIETVIAAAFNGGGAVNGYVTVRPTNPTRKAYMWFTANQTDVLAPTDHYTAAPFRGQVTRAAEAVQIAIGTGGDMTVAQSSTAVLGITVTVANSALVGSVVSDNATAGDVTGEIVADAPIKILFAAAFATTGALNGFVEVTPA